MIPPRQKPDLRHIGERALIEVIDTLLRLSATVEDPATWTSFSDNGDLVTSRIFLAGPRLSGRVRVSLPEAFVSHAAFVLTGLDSIAAEAEGLLDDTAGELANMVAGRVAARLAQDGYPSHLTTPSVSHNPHLASKSLQAVERGHANVICEGHRLAVEVQCIYTEA